METWDYAHCLPYFKRMETCLAAEPGDPFRGHSGPLVLERGPATNPLFGAFFDAVQEAGYPLTDDVNGYRQEGFAPFDRNVHNGKRLSAARAYLHPVMHRQNLEVKVRAFVSKILFEGTRAVGVEFTHGRSTHRVRTGEVVLCGGAINSPQTLMLSGVGHRRASAGTRHRVPSPTCPGVGQNLQDHLEVYIQYKSLQPVSVAPYMKMWRRPFVGAEWLLFKKGPGATNHFEGGGFARSNEDVAYPNLMFHFLPIAIRYDGSAPEGGHGYQVHIGPMYSDARGTVRLTSADPTRAPRACDSTICRPSRIAASGSRRSASLATSWTSRRWARSTAARSHRGRASNRRTDPRVGRARRRDGPAPVVHRRRWEMRPIRCRWSTR